MGSIFERMVRVHQRSRNLPAQAGDTYSQKPWKSSFRRYARTDFRVVAQELGKLDLLALGEVLRTLQQAVAHAFEMWLITVGFEALGLLGADLSDGLVHVRHDVEAVEHMDGFRRLESNHVEVRFPHVRADEPEAGAILRAKESEELEQRRHRTILAHPEQPADAPVDQIGRASCRERV